ncbi:hypothetical protein EOA32_23960 [Mesorhizobium sp. M1A.F.Ca.ET.072.01.1.1]|uniref:hypothetical protein n=1 Tax=Mesorhizobium sp. M1A.F.Ca.ET.072.01.1.1 TaxID=2496753 RepID=UPI000FD2E8A4|nr:hypothetical protein [Mesorhizobium sp. M1A.F.Ca.ET.072.01.1.1]RUW49015.1 hypothetical protein EOA32_23960 [Mesorhizobium sp. M1A.F.Ca.ET.072.01.1.1]TIV03247.1 MAG: hypothetical protein E5W04_09395 [Mesorhizobium sp.]
MSFSLPGHREQLYALSRSGGEVTVSIEGDKQMSANTPPDAQRATAGQGMGSQSVGQGLRKGRVNQRTYSKAILELNSHAAAPGEHRRRRPNSPALGVTAVRS